MAGRQLWVKLRKKNLNHKRRSWSRILPALKAKHGPLTTVGLSPHQILLGGDRLERGFPLSGDGMATGAEEFFERQVITAREIRQHIKNELALRAKTASESTARKFRGSDPVWVLRHQPMGSHRSNTWFTPGEVVRRIGEDTYRVNVVLGQLEEQHESHLRVREHNICWKHVSLDYTAREAVSDDDHAELDD